MKQTNPLKLRLFAFLTLAIAPTFSYANSGAIQNQVEIPEYVTPSDAIADKVQYEPESKEQPLLVEKESPEQTVEGVKYPLLHEMVVAPEPQVVISEEPIVEQPEEIKEVPIVRPKKHKIVIKKKCPCPARLPTPPNKTYFRKLG